MSLSFAGGVTPRRITCVGYCLGGAVANLTALFAALQYPTADVRCITFGGQYTGNAAFAEAFGYVQNLQRSQVHGYAPPCMYLCICYLKSHIALQTAKLMQKLKSSNFVSLPAILL